MTGQVIVRPMEAPDYLQWRVLWDAYNAFYGREGATALDEEITAATWERLFQVTEPVHGLVAEMDGRLLGFVHFIYHRSTSRLANICYLQDLFTEATQRGQGIGRKLILRVYELAQAAGCSRVYWQTQLTNSAGRALYDKVAKHHGFIVYSHEL